MFTLRKNYRLILQAGKVRWLAGRTIATQAVTPHAPEFGFGIMQLGNLAFVSSALGRTMSPIAGVVIMIAGICREEPLEMAKRTALGSVVGIVTLLLFF